MRSLSFLLLLLLVGRSLLAGDLPRLKEMVYFDDAKKELLFPTPQRLDKRSAAIQTVHSRMRGCSVGDVPCFLKGMRALAYLHVDITPQIEDAGSKYEESPELFGLHDFDAIADVLGSTSDIGKIWWERAHDRAYELVDKLLEESMTTAEIMLEFERNFDPFHLKLLEKTRKEADSYINELWILTNGLLFYLAIAPDFDEKCLSKVLSNVGSFSIHFIELVGQREQKLHRAIMAIVWYRFYCCYVFTDEKMAEHCWNTCVKFLLSVISTGGGPFKFGSTTINFSKAWTTDGRESILSQLNSLLSYE